MVDVRNSFLVVFTVTSIIHADRQHNGYLPRICCESMTEKPNHSSSSNESDEDTQDDSHSTTSTSTTGSANHGDMSGEAAGVVRGVSKSIVRAPFVGRLPKAAPKLRVPKAAPKPPATATRGLLKRRVPVRRVARVSDQVSTGLEFYTSALEAKTETDHNATTTTSNSNNTATKTTTTATQQWLLRARSFAWNLFRNTLLGMAVFEAYGSAIGTLAGPSTMSENDCHGSSQQHEHSVSHGLLLHHNHDHNTKDTADDSDDEFILLARTDAYSRASLPVHFFAGSIAGTIHGVASSLMRVRKACAAAAGLLDTQRMSASVPQKLSR